MAELSVRRAPPAWADPGPNGLWLADVLAYEARRSNSPEVALNSLTIGSVVGERYRLEVSLESAAHTSSWQARDQTLDREVYLRFVAESHPHVSAVLDAARQAASVSDHRLARILDIGEEGQGCYVIYEWINCPSLEVQLISGPLSAQQTRAVVGECATALDLALKLGIHHLSLSPAQVYLLPDGNIRLTELAVAAALGGVDFTHEDWTGPQAAAADARALIALCYALLTARWPIPRGDGPMSLLPQANTVLGQPVPPSQLVANIPADLDTLCSQSFGGSGAPATPGLVAQALAPWQEVADSAPRSSPPRDTANATILLPAVESPPLPRTDPGLGTAMFSPVAVTPEPGPEPPWQSQWVDGEDITPNTRATGQSKSVIAVFGAFIILMAFLGFFGLRGISKGISFGKGPGSPAKDLQSGQTPAESKKPSPSGGANLRIVASRGFDPQGDGSENDDRIPRAYDKSPETTWGSKTYTTELFGSLKKGVGIELSFAQPSTITQVVLTGVAPGTEFEVRPSTGNQLSSTVLSSAKATGGPVTLQLREPVTAQSILLWSTRPGQVSGGFRVEIAELRVS